MPLTTDYRRDIRLHENAAEYLADELLTQKGRVLSLNRTAVKRSMRLHRLAARATTAAMTAEALLTEIDVRTKRIDRTLREKVRG